MSKTLAPGIYCPTVTFFKPTKEQEIDLDLHVKHMDFLAKSGIDGVVLQGSTGEAVALDREERKQLIKTAKEAFRAAGNNGAIIGGTVGAQSTREAIQLSVDAAEAGADFTLTLPPSYFPAHMTPDALEAFFVEVADASPIPVLIYSYPGVSSGIQLPTDLTIKLAKHPNIAGIKHTDHDVGRIAREANLVSTYGSPFTVLGGATDYMLGALAVGGEGSITGMSNVAPRVVAKAFELAKSGQTTEALKIAGIISHAEWALGKGGLLGTKYATVWGCGYPATAALARRPLPKVSQAVIENIESACAEIVALERQLEKTGYVGKALKGGKIAASNGVNGHANGSSEKTSLLDTVKQKVAAL